MSPDKPYSPWNAPDPKPWDLPDPPNAAALRGDAASLVSTRPGASDEPTCFACQRRYPAGNTHCSQCGRILSPPKPYSEMTTDELEVCDYGRSPRSGGGAYLGALLIIWGIIASLGIVVVAANHAIHPPVPVRYAVQPTHGFEGAP